MGISGPYINNASGDAKKEKKMQQQQQQGPATRLTLFARLKPPALLTVSFRPLCLLLFLLLFALDWLLTPLLLSSFLPPQFTEIFTMFLGARDADTFCQADEIFGSIVSTNVSVSWVASLRKKVNSAYVKDVDAMFSVFTMYPRWNSKSNKSRIKALSRSTPQISYVLSAKNVSLQNAL